MTFKHTIVVYFVQVKTIPTRNGKNLNHSKCSHLYIYTHFIFIIHKQNRYREFINFI